MRAGRESPAAARMPKRPRQLLYPMGANGSSAADAWLPPPNTAQSVPIQGSPSG